MDSKDICLRILRAESESAVSEIIDSVPELSDAGNWHPIDGRETNFNVVTNQASTGSKALTELCTNMVDAVLMRHAHEKGVPLRGENAPQSVIEGVRELVRLRGARSGILAEVDSPTYLREFAEKNLVIGVTGTGRSPQDSLCFTFVDTGEGQHPKDFEDTFLSLSKGNKSAIPFVQGKYNMGSSGVLSYCGRRWHKLIVSRRYDSSGDWGWTLVRRRPVGGMPIAEYFKPAEGIPSFSSDALYPMQLQTGEQDDKVSITTGTVVKLYDYQMELSADFRSIRESLNENLVSTILPFRLMDYRQTPAPSRGGRRALGIDERPVNGMEFLLLRKDGREELSDADQDYTPGTKQYIGSVDDPELGHISVQAIVLGRDIPGWLKPPRNTSRVFHAVNGQVQFKENRAYLSRRCKLPGLKDRIVVIVDSSDLSEAGYNDVWKSDRENVRATGIGQLYRDKVTEVIANSEFLKDLQRRIALEETEEITKKGQRGLFQSLVNSDPSIAQLLPGGSVVTLPGHIGRGTREPEEFQGKYSPTFLNLIGRVVRRDGAEIAVNGSRRVRFETDAANNYLDRPDNQGRVYAIGNDGRFSFTTSLYNGSLTINFTASQGKVVPGEEIALTITLLHASIPEPVSEQLKLRVVAERKPAPPGPRTPRPGRDGGGDAVVEARGLPPTKWLTMDGRSIGDEETDSWTDDFNAQDGGKITDYGDDQKVYCINYDNAHFRRVLDAERDDISKRVIVEQYRVGMLVLMMGFEDAYSRVEEGDVKETLEDNIDYIRRLAAQGAATVVMSIAKTLPTIINPAALEDVDD